MLKRKTVPVIFLAAVSTALVFGVAFEPRPAWPLAASAASAPPAAVPTDTAAPAPRSSRPVVRATRSSRSSAKQSAPAPQLIRYNRRPGDVLTYRQIFQAERQVAPDRPEFFKFRIEWSVKVAIMDIHDGTARLAIQYNREKVELLNREELAEVLPPERIFEAFYEQTDFEFQSVRVVEVDEFGLNLNHSYYFNEMFSGLHPLASRVFGLPRSPVAPGDTFTVEAEEPVRFTYKGLTRGLVGDVHLFDGEVAGGWIKASFFKDLGVLDRLEYYGEYLVNRKLVRESFLYAFTGKSNSPLLQIFADEKVNKAALMSALRRDTPAAPAWLVKTFLASGDRSKRQLAAAYCALRGIPANLDLPPYLSDSDPVVRFNAAKALALFAGDLSPMKAVAADASDPLGRRAANFLERSTYFVPARLVSDYQALQDYIYAPAVRPLQTAVGLEDVKTLLGFMKPRNYRRGGFYKELIKNPETGATQPYYVYLPVDYDPAEFYPLIVYFGGGDGRGDQALAEAYQELMRSNDLAGYILFVPQASGMWWEEPSVRGFVESLRSVLRSFSVDTNQMYAAGTSNGAMAAFFYGTHLADRFAAIFSNMGYPVVKQVPPEEEKDREVLRNLKNTAVFMVHGDADTMVFPVGDQRAYQTLRRLKYRVTYEEWAGRNHDIRLKELRTDIVNLFRENIRRPLPEKIEFAVNDLDFNSNYWIRVDRAGKFPALISAELDAGKREIRIRTDGVEALTVFLRDDDLNLAGEIRILVNGKVAFKGVPQRSSALLLDTARNGLDPALTYDAALALKVD